MRRSILLHPPGVVSTQFKTACSQGPGAKVAPYPLSPRRHIPFFTCDTTRSRDANDALTRCDAETTRRVAASGLVNSRRLCGSLLCEVSAKARKTHFFLASADNAQPGLVIISRKILLKMHCWPLSLDCEASSLNDGESNCLRAFRSEPPSRRNEIIASGWQTAHCARLQRIPLKRGLSTFK